ncbi:MAG: signal recognition particle-docking protein FtsY [Mariprofundaceae bacterium]|nr:signal recognition particle-docking protein FtsY [Mariprofundaceae bacterium]
MGSLFSRLKKGLSRSRDTLAQLIPGHSSKTYSEETWQDVEDALIMADCGPALATRLVEKTRKSKKDLLETLKNGMLESFSEPKAIVQADKPPFVLLVVGVNGTGKTTTIGKLATMYRQQGKSVLIGAGDTFRAAAVEQLAVWVERAGADMVRQHDGADPAAVAFDTVQRGVARHYDVVIIDTAGRVQTDKGLMNELAKVRRVIEKALAGSPHEVWHVVDGGTGQNAVVQVDKFREVAGTTGLIVTKLDGSAKGGIVLQLSDTYDLPIRYIGVGESLEDLMPFDANEFVSGLLPDLPEDREE